MEDFEVYVRTLQPPNALRAGMEYFAMVWEDAEHNKESARTKLTMPVLALGRERAIGTMCNKRHHNSQRTFKEW